MQGFIANTLETWASVYANHAALRTAIGFLHVGGLVLGGGSAISADRQALIAMRRTPTEKAVSLRTLRGTHRVVLLGIIAVTISGLLLFAADSDSFWHSTYFWIKMGLFTLLLINGGLMLQVETAVAKGDARAWSRLHGVAIASIVLWLLTTLFGAALPNVG
jgi:uncharacterized membrane protein